MSVTRCYSVHLCKQGVNDTALAKKIYIYLLCFKHGDAVRSCEINRILSAGTGSGRYWWRPTRKQRRGPRTKAYLSESIEDWEDKPEAYPRWEKCMDTKDCQHVYASYFFYSGGNFRQSVSHVGPRGPWAVPHIAWVEKREAVKWRRASGRTEGSFPYLARSSSACGRTLACTVRE